MKIEQKQAEQLVYEQLMTDYASEEIAKMPYKVYVVGDKIHSVGDGWRDIYKIEYMPQLMLIGH